eukprot:1348153-Rhodomonas_salina.1
MVLAGSRSPPTVAPGPLSPLRRSLPPRHGVWTPSSSSPSSPPRYLLPFPSPSLLGESAAEGKEGGEQGEGRERGRGGGGKEE